MTNKKAIYQKRLRIQSNGLLNKHLFGYDIQNGMERILDLFSLFVLGSRLQRRANEWRTPTSRETVG